MKLLTSIGFGKTISVMSAHNPPVTHIAPGEIIEVHTLDCFSNRIKTEHDVLRDLPWETINPCTGPIYIEGAVKGDILRIHIRDIKTGNTGVMVKDAETLRKYNLNEHEKALFASVYNNKIALDGQDTILAKPMIGVIGVAPEKEEIPTTLPGDHGGNMDNKMIKKGSIVYLPVFHDGALLAIGDLHAAMGDGEAAGCGIEISGCVTLKIDVVKDTSLPTPMIEADDKIIMVASATSLDEAADKSVGMMLDYMMNHCAIPSDLAWKYLSAMGEVKICQFTNKIKTVRCEMTKRI